MTLTSMKTILITAGVGLLVVFGALAGMDVQEGLGAKKPPVDTPITGTDKVEVARDYKTTTYQLPDGTYRLNAHAGDIRYKDAQGNFVDSDISFADMGTHWEMSKHNYHLRVAKNFGAARLLQFENVYDGASTSITYEPHSLVWYDAATDDMQTYRTQQNVTGTISGNTIRYTNAFGAGVNFEVTLHRSGFRKEVVIPNKPANMPTPPGPNYKLYALFKYTGDNILVKKNDGTTWNQTGRFTADDGFVLTEAANDLKRTFIKPAYAVDSSSTAPMRLKLNVTWMLRNRALWQAKEIPIAQFATATYPVRFDTVTGYYAGAGDGYVEEQTCNSFSIVRGAAGDVADYTTGTILHRNQKGGGCYNLWSRSIFQFDTSALGSGATISSSTVYIYSDAANTLQNFSCGASAEAINLYKTTTGSNTTLSTSDYGISNWTLTQLSDNDVSYSAWDADRYQSFGLNSTGKSAINKTGYTVIGLLTNADADNSDPACGSYGYRIYGIRMSETSGTGNDPYIEIEYTASGGATPAPTAPGLEFFQ